MNIERLVNSGRSVLDHDSYGTGGQALPNNRIHFSGRCRRHRRPCERTPRILVSQTTLSDHRGPGCKVHDRQKSWTGTSHSDGLPDRPGSACIGVRVFDSVAKLYQLYELGIYRANYLGRLTDRPLIQDDGKGTRGLLICIELLIFSRVPVAFRWGMAGSTPLSPGFQQGRRSDVRCKASHGNRMSVSSDATDYPSIMFAFARGINVVVGAKPLKGFWSLKASVIGISSSSKTRCSRKCVVENYCCRGPSRHRTVNP